MINTLEYTAELARETAYLYQRVESVIPEIEWPTYAPFVAAINHLKKERNAVILAHNYQTPEIFHCVADITGDSLAVARKAIETDAEIIVLAGVYYADVTPLSVDPPRPVWKTDRDRRPKAQLETALDLARMCASVPWRSPVVVIGGKHSTLGRAFIEKVSIEQYQEVRKNDASKPLISKQLANGTFDNLVTGSL